MVAPGLAKSKQELTEFEAGLFDQLHTPTIITDIDGGLLYEDPAAVTLFNSPSATVDLDGFKQVNDKAGHTTGDEVLKAAAQLLTSGCRTSDFVARLGSDEFAILLADCPIAAAEKICNTIINIISHTDLRFGDVSFRVGASIGLSTITAATASAAQATGEADNACYRAKAMGKGCVAT